MKNPQLRQAMVEAKVIVSLTESSVNIKIFSQLESGLNPGWPAVHGGLIYQVVRFTMWY